MLVRLTVTLWAAFASLAAGFGLGWLLDGVAESRPLLTLFFTLIGLVVAVALIWSRMHKVSDRGAGST